MERKNQISAAEFQAQYGKQTVSKSKKARLINLTTISAGDFRKHFVDQDEHDLQALCVDWFRLAYPMLRIVNMPNGAERTKAERGRALEEGMLAGWPDLHVVYPSNGYHGLYLEMKTVNGRVSDAQAIQHAYLRSTDNEVAVPTTFEEFQQAVNSYLSHP